MCVCLCRIVNARCLETRIEVEGNGSVDSWGALELVCRRVQDRAIRTRFLSTMCTEKPGHSSDHQEVGPGDGGNCITGLHPLPFCTSASLNILGVLYFLEEISVFICNWIKKGERRG